MPHGAISFTRDPARIAGRASFVSVPDLKQAIDDFMQAWNDNPRPFIWTATVSDIIAKIERARLKMESIKPGSTLPRGKKAATNS